ncbi:hypothetical protein C8Q77DRAFT_1055691, partial [Trametes polyzona]
PHPHPQSPTMSDPSSATRTPAIREYEVYALAGYSVFVYDGGIIDGNPVFMHGAALLKDTTRTPCVHRFLGRVTRVLDYQEDWVVVEITRNLPRQRVAMAVRYRKLGGWYGNWIRMVRRIRRVFGLLSPNSYHVALPSYFLQPFSYDVRLRTQPSHTTISSFDSVSPK